MVLTWIVQTMLESMFAYCLNEHQAAGLTRDMILCIQSPGSQTLGYRLSLVYSTHVVVLYQVPWLLAGYRTICAAQINKKLLLAAAAGLQLL